MNFILNIDNAILDFIQNNLRSSFLDKVIPVITSLGNAGILWIIIAIILVISKKYRKYGIIMAIALVIMLIFGNGILKNLFQRVRPYEANGFKDLLIKKPIDTSFPSGHTYASFASAGVLYYMNKKVGITAYILAALIAFSRLYLYVHYPSDVLGGMILGILTSFVAIKIYNNFEKKRKASLNN